MERDISNYSHVYKDTEGNIVNKKLLKTHIWNIIKICQQSFCKNVNFSFDNEYIEKLLIESIKYHDLGKYTSFFQNYLFGENSTDKTLSQHSRIGAYSAYNKIINENEKAAVIAYYLIKNHHSNLPDILKDKLFLNSERDFLGFIFNKQKNDIANKIDIISNELEIQLDDTQLSLPPSRIRRNVKLNFRRTPTIENYFLINYLFSILIESDKLEASDTNIHRSNKIEPTVVDNYLNNFAKNYLKDRVKKNVVNKAKEKSLLENNIFTLTAPTGIGKTLTSLEFALRIREKLKDSNNKYPQIIYVLPFINIIEQAFNVYEEVIPNNSKILAHYQYSDLFSDKNNDTEKNYNQKLMTLETWQSDIVITSFVQFLKTLIGNKNSALKKFHHFADSIIILDEVQAIKINMLPLIGAILFYLTKFLNTKVILMTATRPLIFELANKILLNNEGENASSYELLDNFEEIYKHFNRTKISPINLDEVIDEDDFVENFNDKWHKNKSVLIVCNTINRSLRIFYKLKQYKNTEDIVNPIYYLSTNIVKSYRLDIIKKVNSDIEKGVAPILISTQSIEAGVDLSFDMAFRDLAPIDSIIQVAGRVNRVDSEKETAPVYILNFNDCKKIYGEIANNISKNLLNKYAKGVEEKEYLSLIGDYFNELSTRVNYDESINFFEATRNLRYDENDTDETTISSFKVIEDKPNYRSVFIESDESASESLLKFKEMLNKKISKEEFASYKQNFYQHVLQIPVQFTESIPERIGEELLVVTKDVLKQYYNSETGFIRIDEQYENSSSLIMP